MAVKNFDEFKKELMNKIKDSGELAAVFDMLMPALSDASSLLDEFIVLKHAYKEFERNQNKQLISLEDYNVGINRIVNGLINFIRDDLTEQDLVLTFNNATNAPEIPPLSRAIQEMGFKKPLNKAVLVNCDRQEASNLFCEFFGAKEGTPYQFYFIVGNSEQLPEGFGERLIYTIMDEFTANSDTAIDFKHGDDDIFGKLVNRALVEKLPAKLKLDLCKQEFKRYTDERFTLGETTLEDFIASKSKQLAFEYIAFVFEYDKRIWNTDMLNYFDWLIQTFRQNHTDKPTFLFFFVIKTDLFADVEKVRSEVEELVNRYAEASLLMPDLMSVPLDDIRGWLKIEAQAKDKTKIDTVLATYLATINRSGTTEPIEMMYLETLQKTVFAASLSTI